MFKKISYVAIALFLSACASQAPTPVIIAPKATNTQDLMSVNKIDVIDLRKNPALAIINGKNMPINNDLIPNLKSWLNRSLDTNPYGSKTITFNILSYASYVKQETVSFTLESVMEWQVQVDSDSKVWKKSFQSTIKEEGPLIADNSIVEKHLNKLAETLLDRSVKDHDFQQAVFN